MPERPCPFCDFLSSTPNCPQCRRSVTASRKVCPHCGGMTPVKETVCVRCHATLRHEMVWKVPLIIGIVVAAIVLSGVLQLILQ